MLENIPSQKIEPYTNIIRMSDSEFKEIAQLVHLHFGINLSAGKKILAESRLNSLLRKHKLSSFSDYLTLLKSDTTGKELIDLANNISTNHTYFYREHKHFEYMRTHILPYLFSSANQEEEIRIWSAPCSTGEEAYTIAMTVHDYMVSNHLTGKKTIKILATDISIRALDIAKRGLYDLNELRHLPSHWKNIYFKKQKESLYEVSPKIKNWIKFARLNFMDTTWPFKKQFHLIFCRNVMIYFDLPTKERLIKNFHNYLQPSAYLIISLSESMPTTIRYLYQQEITSIFRKI